MTKLRLLMVSLVTLLTLLYPLAVYLGIQYWQPWKIAVILFVLLLLRLLFYNSNNKASRWIIVFGLAFCALAVWNNNLITLRFYPALVNLGLFITFTLSLFFPPPVIERFARLQHPDLPEQGIIYTRKVTQVWSVFFVFNGLMALITALWCSFAWWSLYNGLIAYLLMALLMAVEYWVRIRTQAHVR